MNKFILLALLSQCLMAEPVRSVCDILRNIASFRDQPVTIRGQWVTGLEQSFLVDDRCRDDFALDYHTWPAAIYLRRRPQGEDRESIQNVERSLQKKLGQVWRISPDVSERFQIRVTVKGILRALPQSGDPAIPPSHRPLGFGHLNGSALQLDITSMHKPQIIKRRPTR